MLHTHPGVSFFGVFGAVKLYYCIKSRHTDCHDVVFWVLILPEMCYILRHKQIPPGIAPAGPQDASNGR